MLATKPPHPARPGRSWLRAAQRLAALSSVLAVAGLSAGCDGGGGGDSATGTDSTRAALLTAGPVSDQGWYAGAYEGLMMLRDSLGMAVSHQQTRTPAEFDEAFLSYAGSGYDLIFAHGFEYQDAAIRAGERFPDVTIIVSGGGRIADNVVPLIFTLEEASYLAGMLAGGTTRTDTVGMVGGVAIPSVQGTFRAFEAGARAVNPGVTVLEAFIGNWDDVAAAKEAAVAQLGRGADVLIHNTDAASFGVFQAVREAVAAGHRPWALGMNRDQNAVAPDVILGSAVIRIPEAFLQVARHWAAGNLGSAEYEGLATGVVDLVVNPALDEVVDATLLDRIDVARQAIRAGTLDVPRVPFVEGEAGMAPGSQEAPD